MIEVFICDNDRTITEYLRLFISERFGDGVRMLTFNVCADLVEMLEFRERVPDILLTDVKFRDGDGIQVVKALQTRHPEVKVIYLTGEIGCATEIFQTDPTYFLTKPVDEDKLTAALEKAVSGVEKERRDSVVIKMNGSESLIGKKKIIYVESRGRRLIFYLNDGSEITVYEKMDVMQEQLGPSFVRSHKSFLINLKYIAGRNSTEFCLCDGKVLPISKSNLKQAREAFIAYWGEPS